MRRTLNRLLVFYLGAILVLAFSVYAGLHVQMQGTQQVADDARTINVSGRQRMLSQRIIYLATDLARFPDATTEGELRAVIADFERSHEALSTASPLSAELQALYFSASEPSLDARVRSYIDAARRVAADPADTGSLDRLRAIEQA
ncbi:MAG: type IV pili methyl-accepting chemotaxis transducer N-terminal domain-containing protein, partial [Myxococcota bacterium]